MTVDTITVRIRSALIDAAREAYGPPAGTPARCAACGSRTDTRDGYPAATPLGEVLVCPPCNRDPLLWDATEAFFTGAMKETA